jgi:site-specific DNA-methyltransferase (adenine-specific)/modification methylase
MSDELKAGKVVRIGDSVTLYLADCRDVLPMLAGVDAFVTDPPYGAGFAAQPTRSQRANGMKPAAWDDDAPQGIVDGILALGLPTVIWGGNYFRLPASRGWLVWSKRGNAPSMADAEMAWTSLDMNARSFEKTVKSASLEKNLQTAPHPSQKPVALMQWSLGFLPAAKVVCDPFMGTGTTGVACIREGRRFIGIERDPEYFETACNRIRRELEAGTFDFAAATARIQRETAQTTFL